MPYYICAAAFDYKGEVTPMWMSEPIDWRDVEPRPIEELIEKIDASEANIMMLGIGANGKVVPISPVR